jgi:hypothetical protein
MLTLRDSRHRTGYPAAQGDRQLPPHQALPEQDNHHDEVRLSVFEILVVVGFFAAWMLLQRVILPKMGVPT